MTGKQKVPSGEAHVPESYHRPNFLYQASCSVVKKANSELGLKIAACYGAHMVNIGKKLLLKFDKDIKRTVCKGCNTVLVPGETAEVKITKDGKKKKKQKKLEITCNLCSFKRPFLLNKQP